MEIGMNDDPEIKYDSTQPVYVIESIPVAGEHQISAEDIKKEGIPTPPNLVLYPELGRGGIGRIHAATDRNLLRHVALKRIDKRLAEVPMYREGFIAEAQMTGQLEHPNIVPVHELSVGEGGVPYFTMKLVQGIGLDRRLRPGLSDGFGPGAAHQDAPRVGGPVANGGARSGGNARLHGARAGARQ